MTEIAAPRMSRHRAEGSILGEWWHTVDRWALGAILALVALGLMLSLAASPPLAEENGRGTYHYFVRHAVYAVLGLGTLFGVSMLSPRGVRRLGVLLFIGFAAAVCLLPWLGTSFGKGAVRWFSLGPLTIQPSEFLKTGFVLTAAWLISGSFQRNGPPGRAISGALALGLAVILALQPDFGQALLLVTVWCVVVFVSGAPLTPLIALGGVIGAAGAFAYAQSAHFRGRIDAYLAGGVDPNTQLGYAESAIREGGLFGVGAAKGSVKWTLPDAHTDFIIAVAAEEFGLILVLAVLGLYLFVTVRTLLRVTEERDPFIRLGAVGLATLFGLQAFINMGVAIRLLPAKGMTLPFISYGGSSMLAAALAIGALLALTRSRPSDSALALRTRL